VVDLQAGALGCVDGRAGGGTDHDAVADDPHGQRLAERVAEDRDEVDVREGRDVVAGVDVDDGARRGRRGQSRDSQ
jgi:hypothetical protein